jgi:localization factor PodJL
VAGELAERIKQSEERTARLLEDARQKIDERLAETQRKLTEATAPAPAPEEVADDGAFRQAPFPGYETPAAEQSFRAAAAPSPFATRPLAPAFEDEDFAAAATFGGPAKPIEDSMPIVRPASDDEDGFDAFELEPNVGFDVDDDFVQTPKPMARAAPAAAAPPPSLAASEPAARETAPEPTAYEPTPHEPTSYEPPPASAAAPLTTREVIERARAAARAASDGAAPRARLAKPADEGVLQGLAFGRSRRRNGPTSALIVASLMAAIGLSAGGYVFFEAKPGGQLPKRVADALSVVSGDTAAGSAETAPLAALALAPKPADVAAPIAPDLSGAYSAARAKLNAGQAGGLAAIKKLADAGYAPAEFDLAVLYQDGKAGLAKDPSVSRRWLEKAAEGGDRTAMHNLALDEHEGIGGPRNAGAAAEWFRRAAELGLLDSQFNLAAIYERGDGVTANPAEAYKWYLVAARSGDAGARSGALRVRTLLTPDARAVAERAAAAFQPAAQSASTQTVAVQTAPASPELITAQRALNQLGYYQGPTDGVASPALHLALAAYQRDQSLPVTGSPDPATVGKLSVYTR